MIRYVRQKDDYSCGPVALINAIKWLGYNYPYKDNIFFIKKLCDCKKEEDWSGTHYYDLSKALKKLKIKNKFNENPKISEIIEHIENEGSLILRELYKENKEWCGHYFFIYGYDSQEKEFLTVNSRKDETMSKISLHDLKKSLSIKANRLEKSDINRSICWFIFKNPN